ncbi:uncharacterized protein DDB_G0283697-like isoform X1 [Trichogramma pretiosum]|uniref:uncharacterized protein DDB_G0283697-like isoform X1 n=1 Tax=Trichogramma pretiosum TaxID=7493 RepID=UPI0006C9AB82|nr:uncharacterized protein DDB_G0283697-like isoform X1 [Trichogramma pretiosum]XP_014235298.1 uncharacterized protein DDB_G0283697-like isoform X1 [Trichogramma pretiosum]XP_014235299.1 uncharacterized protein DDB_G0283697-like isoform X1 [Trichogramma pretiosum]XP_023316590.1 uncharacterized protein DDB_G0283697-like isoform X1 [Trichogramma pretiosum]
MFPNNPSYTGTVPKTDCYGRTLSVKSRNETIRLNGCIITPIPPMSTSSIESHRHSQLATGYLLGDTIPTSECVRQRQQANPGTTIDDTTPKNSNTSSTSPKESSSQDSRYPEISWAHFDRVQHAKFLESLLPTMLPTLQADKLEKLESAMDKPTNTDTKLPSRATVERNLKRIQGYINDTTQTMDELCLSTDPRAKEHYNRLATIVEDLRDSEKKLSVLLESSQKFWQDEEDGGVNLRKKLELTEQKLQELKDEQHATQDLSHKAREGLDQLRRVQREAAEIQEEIEENEKVRQNLKYKVMKKETLDLRQKLVGLERKKKNMDQLVDELNSFNVNDKTSSSTGSDRESKLAELEKLKIQLAHVKSVMNQALLNKEKRSTDDDDDDDDDDDVAASEETNPLVNFDEEAQNSEPDASSEPDTCDEDFKVRQLTNESKAMYQQVQSATAELLEQQKMLLLARTELRQKLKEQLSKKANDAIDEQHKQQISAEKKESNKHVENDVKKDKSSTHSSRQNSLSRENHVEKQPKSWAPAHFHAKQSNMSDSPSVDSAEMNPLLLNESMFNRWTPSAPSCNNTAPNSSPFWWTQFQPPSASFWGNHSSGYQTTSPVGESPTPSMENYKQMLIHSQQSQQIQILMATVQNYTEIMSMQRNDIETLKSAVSSLQGQVQSLQTQVHSLLHTGVVQDTTHCNLDRNHQSFCNPLDPSMTLPPSSSLPNLVTLPNGQSTQTPITQPLQLNNQIPPGNRANNYWDNFRSYSRQNYLSGSSKVPDHVQTNFYSDYTNYVPPTYPNYGNVLTSRPPTSTNSLTSDIRRSMHDARLLQQHLQQHLQQQQPTPNIQRDPSTKVFLSSKGKQHKQVSTKLESDDIKAMLKQCIKALQWSEQTQHNESKLSSSDSHSSSKSSEDESEVGGAHLPSDVGLRLKVLEYASTKKRKENKKAEDTTFSVRRSSSNKSSKKEHDIHSADCSFSEDVSRNFEAETEGKEQNHLEKITQPEDGEEMKESADRRS